MTQLKQIVSSIASNNGTRSLAQLYDLAINTVSWEDTSRSKGSYWGPNISDMTLCVDKVNMPVIRKPNFSDVTGDQSLEKFTVMVGNENGTTLKQIPLKEYLENIGLYTKNDKIRSLLDQRDNVVLISAQACVLPLADGEVEFCVELFNYQSGSDDPGILVIISSAQGTSAQVVYGTTSLYFNDNGNGHNFKAKRLSDDRKARGVSVDDPMTMEEKNRNALFIYQIPLKQKPARKVCFGQMSYNCDNYGSGPTSRCLMPNMVGGSRVSRGFEPATLTKGSYVEKYIGTKNLSLERDNSFPIRCTVQYYNVTDEPTISEAQIKLISETINNTYKTADATGSLILSITDRKTESYQTNGCCIYKNS